MNYSAVGTTLEALYRQYTDDSLLARLEEYAIWTIPSVFPRDGRIGVNQNTPIEYDMQSIGADITFKLGTKLARTLFPANQSFFRLDIDDDIKSIMQKQDVQDVISFEHKAADRIFMNSSYAQIIQAMLLLIITGECLMVRQNESLRVYSLRDYACKRNSVGETLDIIIRECKFYSELPPNVQAIVGRVPADDKLTMYTRIKRVYAFDRYKWKVTQEINGMDIGTDYEYPDKLCPYIPVYWNFVNGDNYGRGYVEIYGSDFKQLSELSTALFLYKMESSKLLYLVDPSGAFDVRHAEEAGTGEYVHGKAGTVTPLEGGSFQKINELQASLAQIEVRLRAAFMSTGNQRDGERVTAYEIRQNAEEAEQVLGGVYSQLAQGLHLPLARLLLNELNPKLIEELELNNFKLNILTGLQALSRSSENQGLVIACSELNTVLPIFGQANQLEEMWNLTAIVEQVLASNGVNVKALQYTEEQLRQRRQALAEAQAAQQAQAVQVPQQLATQESAVQAIQAAQAV